MNTEFKGTNGECELSMPFDGTILIGGNVKAIVQPYSIKGLTEEDRANAELIFDSFNTIQQCNLLPSELLKQNKEMREMLEKVSELFTRKTFPREIEMIAFANEIEDLLTPKK